MLPFDLSNLDGIAKVDFTHAVNILGALCI